jgi:hypothetical protein
MDLGLDFANGRVSGEGNDDVGAFVISGHFDSAEGECDWTKTYIGAHDVFYRGFREGKGIWGTWEILWDARGGFLIWPRSFATANEETVSAEEEMPAPMARH